MVIRPNGHIIVQQAPAIQGLHCGPLHLPHSRAAWAGSICACLKLLWRQLLELRLTCDSMRSLSGLCNAEVQAAGKSLLQLLAPAHLVHLWSCQILTARQQPMAVQSVIQFHCWATEVSNWRCEVSKIT